MELISDGYERHKDDRFPPMLPGIVDHTLVVLKESSRISLIVILLIVVGLSIVGNVATTVSNARSKTIRPFFRTCLISLACGDLLSTIFQGTSYAAQLVSTHPPIWTLGAFMCGAVPFVTTWAVLVNSLVLVAIATDRYVAVGRVWRLPRGCEPSGLFCGVFATVMWTGSAAVAGPMVMRYQSVDLFIIETDPANRTHFIDVMRTQMCLSDKEPNLAYYAVVFGAIYMPLVVSFVLLNGMIAMEIWSRRKPLRASTNGTILDAEQSTGKRVTDTTGTHSNVSSERAGLSETTSSPSSHQSPPTANTPQSGAKRSRREIRQLRMFTAIVCIMLVFLICRLPTWVYLLYKLQNVANSPAHWLLHYALGILSLVNCMINPLLYTFLGETIDTSLAIVTRVRQLWRQICNRCCAHRGKTAAAATVNVDVVKKPFYFSEDAKQKHARI